MDIHNLDDSNKWTITIMMCQYIIQIWVTVTIE